MTVKIIYTDPTWINTQNFIAYTAASQSWPFPPLSYTLLVLCCIIWHIFLIFIFALFCHFFRLLRAISWVGKLRIVWCKWRVFRGFCRRFLRGLFLWSFPIDVDRLHLVINSLPFDYWAIPCWLMPTELSLLQVAYSTLCNLPSVLGIPLKQN